MQTQISIYIRIDQAEKLNQEENKSEVVRKALDLYYKGEEDKMNKEQIIEKLKGNTIMVDYEWLRENDEELLDWITSSKYWGRGFDREILEGEAVVEIYFDEEGISYTATFESHPDGIRQSLNNQPPWGEDKYEDWPIEQLEKYLSKKEEA